MLIKGKVAVVIGGARGLGKDFVHQLLDNGAKVVFGDVLQDAGQQSEREFQEKFGEHNVLFQTCDITSSEQIESLFKAAIARMGGPVEIVANSAGICKEFEWQKTVDVNMCGMIRLSTIALQYMSREHGGVGGVIVHTSSVLAVFPSTHSPVYCATKAAIVHYCKSFGMAEHYARTGVRFNSLLPSHMLTEINDEAFVEGNVYVTEGKLKQQQEAKANGKNVHSTEICAKAMIRIVNEEATNGEAIAVTPARDYVITHIDTEQFENDYRS